MLTAVFILSVASIAIWLSTRYIIEAIERLVSQTRVSRIATSLLLVGIVTSLPEVAVSINALLMHAPPIATGNLVGSQLFLLFFAVPVLAIVSKGLKLDATLKRIPLALALVVALMPMLSLIDQEIRWEEIALILGVYGSFVFVFLKHNPLQNRIREYLHSFGQVNIFWEVIRLLGALAILFLASNSAVRQLIEISALLQTPRFMLGLLILPISTNLPELSLALGKLRSGRKDAAISDYMGSITFNAMLLGILALFAGGSLFVGQNINLVILIFTFGILIFLGFCSSRKTLSIKEGLLLLLTYAVLFLAIIWVIITTHV